MRLDTDLVGLTSGLTTPSPAFLEFGCHPPPGFDGHHVAGVLYGLKIMVH